MEAQMAMARWFYDACISFNALHLPYFQPALDVVATIGPTYKVHLKMILEEVPPPELDEEELEPTVYREDSISIIQKYSKSIYDLGEEKDLELNVLTNIALESFGIVSLNNSAGSNVGANNFMENNPPLIVRDERGSDNDETQL
ncbi:hypothetical protein GH714_009545 [Hevea brasiliensis]|uniref:Uncharacterized protein n=1 Tax=Hevea brasiliensis TaxID=3981 RepID=A0A6A6M0I7_HEVBR|nr:hypothetical protein GH714_009545 [Hevea brasiliensis]